MSRYSPHYSLDAILNAAESWKQNCLLANGAVLGSNILWNSPYLDELNTRYVLSPDEGNRTFLEKLKDQLAGASSEAKQLAAEMTWVMLLCPSNIQAATKSSQVASIWEWSGMPFPNTPLTTSDVLKGIGSAGQGFNTNRWREFAFFIAAMRKWKTLPNANQADLLSSSDKFGEWIDAVPESEGRQLRHMLMYLLFPDRHERIFSTSERRSAVVGCLKKSEREVAGMSPAEIDAALRQIRADEQAKSPEQQLDFYEPPLRERWKKEAEAVNSPAVAVGVRYWIEKTIVRGRPDREAGEHALGQALWSPQKSRTGDKDIYWSMREVGSGDVIIHLINNECISGVSVAAEEVNDGFKGLEGTDWAGFPAYRIQLRDYAPATPPLSRESFFKDPELAAELKALMGASKNLFYTRDLDLNQGSYLTPAPLELVDILQRAYQKQSGKLLPHLPVPSSKVTAKEPDAPTYSGAPYSLEDMARETGIAMETLSNWLTVLRRKKHMVFQGPPGTGKTFVAQRVAKVLSSPRGKVEVVQFHPSYAYEDFIMGLRPDTDTTGQLQFKATPGTFVRFCDEARAQRDTDFVLIVDEMNRANLSRVFGELMYLLEYRQHQVPLAAGKPFSIPENVHLIGTMNTADRSIAVVDHALRRRFAFVTLDPQYDALALHLQSHGLPSESLVETLRAINKAINDPHYSVGTSFFLKDEAALVEALPQIWGSEIEPYLEEFFFDQRDRVAEFRWAQLSKERLSDWVRA